MAAVERILGQAAAHYSAGHSDQAGLMCRDILASQPDYLPALHLSAVIAFAEGRMGEGSAWLGQVFARDPDHVPALVTLADALAVKGEREGAAAAFARVAGLRPHDAELHAKHGTALCELERFAEAEAAFTRALALDPNLLRARFNLAVALAGQGRFAEAEVLYREVMSRHPGYPGGWLCLGNVLVEQGRLDDAVAAYLNALAETPDNAGLHRNLAAVLNRQGDLAGAIVHYRRTVELRPEDDKAWPLLGFALCEAGRLEEALSVYRQCAALDPDDHAFATDIARCLCLLERFEDAVAAADHALALCPDDAFACAALGIACEALGRHEAAVAAHRRCIALDPAYAEGYSNLAVALRNIGALDEALAVSHQAVAIAPENALVRSNHAFFLLMNGDLPRGFAELEWNAKCKAWSSGYPTLTQPQWRGEPLEGRTLLIYSEAGLGDTLQFARYLPQVAAMGGQVIVAVQPALVPLLGQIPGIVVVSREQPIPSRFDLHLPIMALAHVFGTTLHSIPAHIPYLRPDPVALARWRERLGDTLCLKVGVVWSGNPLHKGDRQRSLAADAVLPRLVMPGVQLYSLQKEPRPGDAAVLAQLGQDIIELGPMLSDFTETAAAACALDLVISVDTSVAHLAGALGRPVWLMLPYMLDWRWLRDRADSPWYPTMRLFRQETQRVWDPVLAQVPAELARVAAGERDRLLPAGAPT